MLDMTARSLEMPTVSAISRYPPYQPFSGYLDVIHQKPTIYLIKLILSTYSCDLIQDCAADSFVGVNAVKSNFPSKSFISHSADMRIF